MARAVGSKLLSSYTETDPDKPKDRKWVYDHMGKWMFKKTLVQYNRYRILNDSQKLTQKQWEVLGKMYRPTIRDIRISTGIIRRMFAQEEVKIMADVQLTILLADNDITPKWLIEQRKKLIEVGFDIENLSAVHQSLKVFEEMIGMTKTAGTPPGEEIDWTAVDNAANTNQLDKHPDELTDGQMVESQLSSEVV